MGYDEILALLLKNENVDITAQSSQCIITAAANCQIEILKLLIADKRFPATGFATALYAAKTVGVKVVIGFVLNNPSFRLADQNALGFRVAAEYGHVELVRRGLASSLIDPSHFENEAIRHAAGNGHAEVVKLLMDDSRVDPSDCEDEALRDAKMNCHWEVAKLLIRDERVDPTAGDSEDDYFTRDGYYSEDDYGSDY